MEELRNELGKLNKDKVYSALCLGLRTLVRKLMTTPSKPSWQSWFSWQSWLMCFLRMVVELIMLWFFNSGEVKSCIMKFNEDNFPKLNKETMFWANIITSVRNGATNVKSAEWATYYKVYRNDSDAEMHKSIDELLRASFVFFESCDQGISLTNVSPLAYRLLCFCNVMLK